jgi:3-oxoacyl-(acyl-carrier-protein) synthase
MKQKIYILFATQISAQSPLCEDWTENPILYSEEYVRVIEPNYKDYFSPMEVRRYGKLLKRALLVSRKVMEISGVTNPDAIITGTGLGCIENTEFFLKDLTFGGEELLKPTHFMNSTHNTISSLVAIDSKCRGYNSTYVHKGVSFECALQDAFMQLHSGKIGTALVGGHDEMTPDYFQMLKKTGYLDFSHKTQVGVNSSQTTNQSFAGETAVAMMLSNELTDNALCEIEKVETFYGDIFDSHYALQNTQYDYIVVGTNGQAENDRRYLEVCEKLFPNIPILQYKHIFGESYTAAALGIYTAAICLKNGKIPEHLLLANHKTASEIRNILFYNNFEGKNHSFVLLSKKY